MIWLQRVIRFTVLRRATSITSGQYSAARLQGPPSWHRRTHCGTVRVSSHAWGCLLRTRKCRTTLCCSVLRGGLMCLRFEWHSRLAAALVVGNIITHECQTLSAWCRQREDLLDVRCINILSFPVGVPSLTQSLLEFVHLKCTVKT